MTLSSQILYEEFEGTLTVGNDPSGAGSQASTYGYLAGNGTTMREKLDLINAAQGDTSPRPINVDVRPPSDTVPGPGKITGTVFAQNLKQSVDLDEEEALVNGTAGTAADLAKWDYVKDAYFNAPADSAFAVTDEMQAQLLDAVPNSLMPNTRTNLIASLTIAGSRHQEMDGTQATLEQMQAAEDWRIANKPGSPSLYG